MKPIVCQYFPKYPKASKISSDTAMVKVLLGLGTGVVSQIRVKITLTYDTVVFNGKMQH